MRLLTLETILVATDLTETSDAAIETAVRLADAAGASLHVTHVASPEDDLATETGRRADYEHTIGEALERAGGTTQPTIHLISGEPRRAISLLADTLKADVVVLGRRGGEATPASDRPVGSTAYACITHTLVPVLVVTRPLSIPIQKALVAIDKSEAARGSLLVALSWSSALRKRAPTGASAALTAFHVETGAAPAGASARMQRSVAHDVDILQRNAAVWAGVTVEGLTVTNPDPIAAILRQAIDSDAELVILGTRASREHGDSIWGSLSAAVTAQLSIPVLLVPPAVWRDHARDLDYL
ncbi:MAG: universal stress protein [Gemmatimonadaceae bacterium]